MRVKAKMYYSNGLEYTVSGYDIGNFYSRISYFSKNPENYNKSSMMIGNSFAVYRHIGDNHEFKKENPTIFEPQYATKEQSKYKNQQKYAAIYATNHSFAPEIFLKPTRPKTRFIDDNSKIRGIVEEAFELMLKEKLPSNISINVLPYDEFKAIHSGFGAWSNGILGFSINEKNKMVFVRENSLDALMLVIGHEIGHVLTDTLPNKHDEEAKAFAFSIEWVKTIKEHNIANLSLNIKDELDIQPARNGLHDIAFAFVDFMTKRGRKAMELHNNLVERYVSVFDRVYYF